VPAGPLVQALALLPRPANSPRYRPFDVSTPPLPAGSIIGMTTIVRDTLDGWAISARWPARRRRRFRIGLLLYAVGLRRLASRVAGLPVRFRFEGEEDLRWHGAKCPHRHRLQAGEPGMQNNSLSRSIGKSGQEFI
jgi:hypothetical protein